MTSLNLMEKEPRSIPHQFIFLHAIVACLITAGIAWATPLSFCGYRPDQSSSRFFLFLSDSGAHWGILGVMLLMAILVASRHSGTGARIRKAVLFLLRLSAVLAVLALINEFVTKPFFAVHRPYVLKLEEEKLLSADTYYALARSERADFMRKTLDEKKDSKLVQSLDPKVRKHWIAMTGFSFPSGHSQNAFLFALILSFLIQHLVPNGKRLVWIPFLWAIGICLSRVALGAHSPLDVTVGALTGGLFGGLILLSGWLKKALPEKQPKRE